MHEMYFITKGKVAGVLPSEQNDCEFIRVLEGYYFGDVDILFSLDKRREFSFKAVEDCEMFISLQKHQYKINFCLKIF